MKLKIQNQKSISFEKDAKLVCFFLLFLNLCINYFEKLTLQVFLCLSAQIFFKKILASNSIKNNDFHFFFHSYLNI